MSKNDFKAFATDRNANVMSQEEWEALPALLSGFTAGKASSAQVNKAIRQASFIAAALAQYTANKSGLDVLDDGDLNGFISKMGTAFGKDFQALDATLTALAGLATGENKLPYFTGNDTAAQTDLTSVGTVTLLGKILLLTFSHTLVWEMAQHYPLGFPFRGLQPHRQQAGLNATVRLFLPKSILNWQRLTRQINCLIYVVSLFVAGMMGAALIQGVLY